MNAESIAAFGLNVMQPALERAFPATVTVEGMSYAAAAVLGQLGPVQLADGGIDVSQPLHVTISKSVLAAPHAKGTVPLHLRLGWIIQSIGGHNAADGSWSYTCTRAPGSDL